MKGCAPPARAGRLASVGLDVEGAFVDLLVEGELVEGHLPAVERAAARLIDLELELVAVRELQLALLLVVAELLDDLVTRLPLAGRALGAARPEPRADDAVVLRADVLEGLDVEVEGDFQVGALVRVVLELVRGA